ncbi:MAG: glycosyltransferase family 4 protein [Thermomicrobiales bacterium]
MHIVQLAPPWFPIPPTGYGGIERVIYDLAERMVIAGHKVTLFAPAGSRTSARLIETVPEGIGLDLTWTEKERFFAETGSTAYAKAATLGADIVHDHTDYLVEAEYPVPVVHTVHGPPTEYNLDRYRELSRRGHAFIAISGRQRHLFFEAAERRFGAGEHISFIGVVHNPTDVASVPFYPASAKLGYVAFMGRCHWEKGPDLAIRVAIAAGIPLKMGLRITTEEQPYYEAVVRPLLEMAGSLVENVGEVGGVTRDDLIGKASAVLFTSPWEEPFGLVLTEAAARGTPVVALNRGAAPEVVRDGVTGILCRNEAELTRALPRAMALDPMACRTHACARFDRAAVAARYIDAFELVPDVVAAIGHKQDGVSLPVASNDSGSISTSIA